MKFIKAPLFADDQEMLYPIYEYCQAHEILVTITYGGLWTANVDYYRSLRYGRKSYPAHLHSNAVYSCQ